MHQNRLPRVSNLHFNVNELSGEQFRKIVSFGRGSLHFKTALDEIQPTSNLNHAISADEQLLVTSRFYASGSFL